MSALTKRMSNLLKRNLATSLEKKEAPEVRAPRLIKEFCDASSENSSAADEVIYLPYIRDAVEATPGAAKAAMKTIGKYLGSYATAKPGALYNAVMLLRILTDSPGQAFTQHIDARHVGSIRLMLKHCNKQEPQLILQQTLEYFQREKASDPHLSDMIMMWQSQKNEWSSGYAQRQGPQAVYAPQPVRNPRIPTSLPPPQELAERIAEADTSVQLLTQFLQTTPQEELLGNELIREFTNRCKAARDSVQAYIDCQNPEPDGDTLMTLVQTQQRISAVLNKRNVAVSQARATFGGSSPSPAPSRQISNTANGNEPPVHTRDYATGVTNGNMTSTAAPTTTASGAPQLPPQPAIASDPAARLENPFDDSNQIGQQGVGGEQRGMGALGGDRQRPALSVNTSYSRRQPSSTGNSSTGAAPNATEGIDRNRFRV